MKKHFYALLFLLPSLSAIAQVESHFTQFFQNPYLFNPAAAATQRVIDVSVGHRNQWVGFDGNPSTTYVTGHSEIKVRRNSKVLPAFNQDDEIWFKTPEAETGITKHAVGGKVISDQFGAFARQSALASYAIHLPMNKFINLSFGVGAGVSSMSFRPDQVNLLDEIDNTYFQYLGDGGRYNFFDMQTGLWLYGKDFFVGYSITNLLRNKIGFGDVIGNSRLNMHHYFTAGHHIRINKDLTVSPMFILKYMNPAPSSVDIALKFDYQRWLWGAVAYRHKDAIAIMAGLNFQKMFRFGYSYDFGINSLNNYHSGSHEIMLGIFLGSRKE